MIISISKIERHNLNVCRPHVCLFGTFWVQLGWFDLTVFRLVTSAGEEGSAYLEVVCELLHLLSLSTLLLLARIHIIWCPLPWTANNPPQSPRLYFPGKIAGQKQWTTRDRRDIFNSWLPLPAAAKVQLLKFDLNLKSQSSLCWRLPVVGRFQMRFSTTPWNSPRTSPSPQGRRGSPIERPPSHVAAPFPPGSNLSQGGICKFLGSFPSNNVFLSQGSVGGVYQSSNALFSQLWICLSTRASHLSLTFTCFPMSIFLAGDNRFFCWQNYFLALANPAWLWNSQLLN